MGEWEEYDLDKMDAKMNETLFQSCPFHPHQFIHCLNPQTEFWTLRYKCPEEGCPVFLFEDNRDNMMQQMKYETHSQLQTKLERCSLKCKCRFTPKTKLSRTSRNYNKVFLAVASTSKVNNPVAIFNGFMVLCGGPENKRNHSREDRAKNPSPHE